MIEIKELYTLESKGLTDKNLDELVNNGIYLVSIDGHKQTVIVFNVSKSDFTLFVTQIRIFKDFNDVTRFYMRIMRDNVWSNWELMNFNSAYKNVGTSSERPSNLAVSDIGFCYFDTTLGKPIYASEITNQGTKKWVDSNGAEV